MILLFLTAAGSIPLRQRSPYISCPQEPLSAVLQKLQSGDHHVGAPIAALLMNVCLAVGDDGLPDAGIFHARSTGERGHPSSPLSLCVQVGLG